jgi:hypothetical protein
MTHPEELLADYVDGTLGDDERAVVDAHLRDCALCREEVELAGAAVTALASLEEEPVPLGVTGPVLAEAGRRFEHRRAAFWGRVQWAAGAAAAAALVLVVAVNLGGGGGDADGGGAAAPAQDDAVSEEAAGALAAPSVRLELQEGADYDDAGVGSLAEDAASEERARAEPAPSGASGREGGETAFAGETDGADTSRPGPALRCLRSAGAPVDEPADALVRLIEASYEGTPAYVAVFVESPGAGQPPDKVVVWVVAKEGCRLLSGVQEAI